jgi:hypothetical protein
MPSSGRWLIRGGFNAGQETLCQGGEWILAQMELPFLGLQSIPLSRGGKSSLYSTFCLCNPLRLREIKGS